MIDRPARDQLVAAIEAYMNDEITAFTFDEAINAIPETRDEAVREASVFLWYFYDDCKDHLIVAQKEMWNAMYRMILFLRSDADLETQWHSYWSATQVAAGGVLVLFILLAWIYGMNWPLIIAWIAGGVFAWGMNRWVREPLRSKQEKQKREDLFPFDSIMDIFHARQSVPDFHKKPFPPELAKRRIRSGWLEMNINIPGIDFLGRCLWIIFSPLILFRQMFPIQVMRRSYRFQSRLENEKRERYIAIRST